MDARLRVRCLPGEHMASGYTMGRRQAGRGSVMLWAMFCWKTLGSAIHVDVILTRTTYLSIVADHVHPFMEMVGCELEEKERFWSELDEVMESIPTGERVAIGADFNGHVGEGNRGDEQVMGKFGVKERKDRW
ncbi:hypothetical protein QTP86_019061 [Hemibagrus guttatus]|nr:hypothetical protein QTP86_019061 [Hemibagrus guttatus]